MYFAEKNIKFVALDSSLDNTGMAVGSYTSGIISIEKLYLFENGETINKKYKNTKKRVRRKTKECIEKCTLTFHNIRETLKDIGINTIDVIFIEEPTGSQNSSGMKSYGVTCQLIGVLEDYFKVVSVSAEGAKVASVGNKSASKEDIINWAYDLYPNLEWDIHKVGKYKGQLKDKNEHMADAIAIAYEGIQRYKRQSEML